MKVLLAGSEETKKGLSASSWLLNKYLPKKLDVYWLNYGLYTGRLYTGTYVPLDDIQHGGVNQWAKYIRSYINTLNDEKIMFALDDYLVNELFSIKNYKRIVGLMGGNTVSARLSSNEAWKNNEKELAVDGYRCSTQWCIWDRKALISILEIMDTPWNFEESGSSFMLTNNLQTISTKTPAISYCSNGCISRKWMGIKTDDVKEEDLQFLKKYGYI